MLLIFIINILSYVEVMAQPDVTLSTDLITVGSETRSFVSVINGKAYKLLVHFHSGYNSDKDKRYPILYMLDGQWDFVTMASVYGSQFVQVLEQEIVPLVTQEYRTNEKDRAIAGTSFAGLFSHYVLFHASYLFNGYIINNPGLTYDDSIAFNYEATFAKDHDTLDATLYMVCGQLDYPDSLKAFYKMTEQIRSRNYKNLFFESHIVQGAGHSGE